MLGAQEGPHAHLETILVLLLLFKTYLFYVYEYTVAVFRHSRRGRQIPSQMVVSLHVVAGNWTQDLWKSSSQYFLVFFFWILFFRDRFSLCSPGCPGTHSVDQVGLKLRNPPASVSQVLGLKLCTTTARPLSFLIDSEATWYYFLFNSDEMCPFQVTGLED